MRVVLPLLLTSCGLFGGKVTFEPVDLRVEPESVEMPVRTYLDIQTQSPIVLHNQLDTAIYITTMPTVGEAGEFLEVPPLFDLRVEAHSLVTVSLSYIASAETWLEGTYDVQLQLSVGYFHPELDSGAGPPALRRQHHPDAWTSETIVVPVQLNFICDIDGDGVLPPECGGDDCNDQNDQVAPGKPELCDQGDNDCDNLIDEDPVSPATWYADRDNDRFGDNTTAVDACNPPAADYVSTPGDCDDDDRFTYPSASELCGDGVDNDCDDAIDEGCP